MAFAASVVFAYSGPQLAASASPGLHHTAVGSGVEYEPGACTGSLYCGAAYGAYFAIDASDRNGSYGWMRLDAVTISLSCVVIEDMPNGHRLYASGRGADGKAYYALVTTGAAPAGSFLVSTSPEPNSCGAPTSYGISGYGAFAIAPA